MNDPSPLSPISQEPTGGNVAVTVLREKNKFFFGPNGLCAGWRLLIFIILVYGFGFVIAKTARLFISPQSGPVTQLISRRLLVGECIAFFAVALAAFIMSRIERRPFGVFGLPLREAFGAKF